MHAKILALCTLCAPCITAACGPATSVSPVVRQFADLSVAQEQALFCEQTQGTWYAPLMACACPEATLFYAGSGCRPAPAWQADVEPAGAPHLKHFRLGDLTLRYAPPPDPARGKANKRQAPSDATPQLFAVDRLTLPQTLSLHLLTNALTADIDAAYATWLQDDLPEAGPYLSPWNPQRKRPPTMAKACTATLLQQNAVQAAALCDIATAMQREIRKRGRRKKAVSTWDSVITQPGRDPRYATIRAAWTSPVADATYVVHLLDDGALQRHIRVEIDNERLVLFLDATGNVTAGAWLTRADIPWYFDAQWCPVK